MNDVTITLSASGKRLLITSPYNDDFKEDIRTLGGRWDKAKKAWSVDVRDEQRARALLRSRFGTDGSPEDYAVRVTVRIPLRDYEREGAKALFAGRTIAWRDGRDLPVQLAKGVALVAGKLPAGGGSTRYPEINAGSDVIVEVRDLPRTVLDMYDSSEYEVVSEEAVDDEGGAETEVLRARRDALLAQVRELDSLLRERDPEGEARRQQQVEEQVARSITERLNREHARDKAAAIRELVLAQEAQEQERVAVETAARRRPLVCRCGKHTCPPVGRTVAQHAETAGVTVATVSNWCKRGRIPAVQHAGRWYILAHELDGTDAGQ